MWPGIFISLRKYELQHSWQKSPKFPRSFYRRRLQLADFRSIVLYSFPSMMLSAEKCTSGRCYCHTMIYLWFLFLRFKKVEVIWYIFVSLFTSQDLFIFYFLFFSNNQSFLYLSSLWLLVSMAEWKYALGHYTSSYENELYIFLI